MAKEPTSHPVIKWDATTADAWDTTQLPTAAEVTSRKWRLAWSDRNSSAQFEAPRVSQTPATLPRLLPAKRYDVNSSRC